MEARIAKLEAALAEAIEAGIGEIEYFKSKQWDHQIRYWSERVWRWRRVLHGKQ